MTDIKVDQDFKKEAADAKAEMKRDEESSEAVVKVAEVKVFLTEMASVLGQITNACVNTIMELEKGENSNDNED